LSKSGQPVQLNYVACY